MAIDVPIIVNDALFQVFQSCRLPNLRRYPSEVLGTTVRWARKTDREVQRADGK